jgi:hypothetical protein
LPVSTFANKPRPIFRVFNQTDATKTQKTSTTALGESADKPINGAKRRKAERPDKMLNRNEAGATTRCIDVALFCGSEDARASLECRDINSAGRANRLATTFQPVDGKLNGTSGLIEAGTNHQYNTA